MFFGVYIIVAFSLGIILLLFFRRKTTKDTLLRVLGLLIIFIIIYNSKSINRYFYQTFFWDKGNISKIELIPYKDLECFKTLKEKIVIKDELKVLDLNDSFKRLKSKNPKQPNCVKSFIVSFYEEEKVYSYIINYTSNNGTLVSIFYNDRVMGTFKNDSIISKLYNITKNDFFKN